MASDAPKDLPVRPAAEAKSGSESYYLPRRLLLEPLLTRPLF